MKRIAFVISATTVIFCTSFQTTPHLLTERVVNLLIEVNNRDSNIKIRCFEVYHKTSDNWHQVANLAKQVNETVFLS